MNVVSGLLESDILWWFQRLRCGKIKKATTAFETVCRARGNRDETDKLTDTL